VKRIKAAYLEMTKHQGVALHQTSILAFTKPSEPIKSVNQAIKPATTKN